MLLNKFDFKNYLKNNEFSNIIIFSKDDYFIKLCYDELLKNLKRKNEHEINIIDFEEIDFLNLEQRILSYNFFNSKTYIIIKNIDIKSNTYKNFVKLINQSSEDIIFVLLFTLIDKKAAINTIKDIEIKNNAFYLDIDKESDKINVALNILKKYDCKIDKKTALYLINYLDDNLMNLYSEINKLGSYCYGKIIKIEDINNIVNFSINKKNAFYLIDFIINYKIKDALKLINNLIFNGINEYLILSSIFSTFNDIYRVKFSNLNLYDNDYLITNFDYSKNDFKLNKALRYSDKFNIIQLEKIIFSIYNCDKKLKSEICDPTIILQICIFEIIDIYNKG